MPNFAELKVSFQDRSETIGILGENDEYLRVLNDSFACRILGRDTNLSINGEEGEVNAAMQVIEALLLLYRQGTKLTMHEVRYSIKLVKAGQSKELKSLFTDILIVTSRGKCVRPKTIGQKIYVDAIRRHSITFGLGPAGTGKTYLAVVMAVMALRNHEVDKLILTRPAVEAGERLGFLPGDLQEKIDPYLRPLYDALQDILGLETYQKMLTRNIIEIAPLAYMRGRTLERAFVILDEAQNTTPRQMKMFLTRLGFGSKMVVNGDLSQIDLPRGGGSGLTQATKILDGLEGISVIQFDDRDVIRHDVVARIIRAYDAYEATHTEHKNSEKDNKN